MAGFSSLRNLHRMTRIGVISDTHGQLRPQALELLRGCDHIIHGGDVGKAEVLTQLSQIAPVTAVRGNNDKGAWADSLAETQLLEIEGIRVFVLHDLSLLDIDPVAAGVQVVVSGHSHKPAIDRRDGVVYLNPGSAGPRRFRLPVSVAELTIAGGEVTARIVVLEV
jgi:putative phosphoesterase